VVVAADHLVELVVAADPALLDELAERALRPLAVLSPARREPLLATLRAWLDHDGDRQAVAEALVVHPQTVSYRLARLRELLGGALDDPRARLGLRLATAARAPGSLVP
jgi:DNA-binding PucR family transcriptional regulator